VKVLKGGLKLEDTKLGSGKVATLGKRVHYCRFHLQ
jgi:hypothetical protein